MYQPDVGQLLFTLSEHGGSDLHLKVGSPPCIRVAGDLERVEGAPVLRADDTQEMLLGLMNSAQRKEFEDEHELDFAYAVPGLSRFRVNAYFQRGSIGAVFRTIPIDVPTAEDLELPPIVLDLAMRPRGLVLVTGPTGSGKSTTLAAMIDHINRNKKCHIMTIEDPIEFMHRDQLAIVNQREVGSDTKGFNEALKRVLRQDPDVILVGELRDLETISAACTAAETGHLVFGTLHTTSAPSTIDRMIDVFPPHQQEQIRMQLSITLQGVISQTLLPKVGGGRVAAREIMVCLTSIANLIREAKTHQMVNMIQSGSRHGMHTLDQNLAELVGHGLVAYEEAEAKAQDPAGFEAQCGQLRGKRIAPAHVGWGDPPPRQPSGSRPNGTGARPSAPTVLPLAVPVPLASAQPAPVSAPAPATATESPAPADDATQVPRQPGLPLHGGATGVGARTSAGTPNGHPRLVGIPPSPTPRPPGN